MRPDVAWDAFMAAPKRLDGQPTFRPQPNSPDELRAFYTIVFQDGRVTGFRLVMVVYPRKNAPSFTILISQPTLIRVTSSFGSHAHVNVNPPPEWPRLVKGPRWFPYLQNRDRISPSGGKEGHLLALPLGPERQSWTPAFQLLCEESKIELGAGQPPKFPEPTDLLFT
jgi:hypothetical protein